MAGQQVWKENTVFNIKNGNLNYRLRKKSEINAVEETSKVTIIKAVGVKKKT